MHLIVQALLAVPLVVALSACGADGPPSAYRIDVVGCGVAQVQRSADPTSTALEATVAACPGANDAVGRVARAVWLSSSGAVDSLRIRIGPASHPTELSHAELTNTCGEAGRSARSSTSFLWPLLLLVPVAAASAAALIVRRRPTGVVVLLASR